jgi:hypothetical protein
MHEVFFSALRSPHLLVDDAHSVYFLFSFLPSKKTPVRSKFNNLKKSPVELGAYKTSFKLVTAQFNAEKTAGYKTGPSATGES